MVFKMYFFSNMAILGIHVSFQGVYILKTIHSPLREMLVTTFQSPSCYQKAPKLPVETSSLWPKKLGIIPNSTYQFHCCVRNPSMAAPPIILKVQDWLLQSETIDPSWMNSILQYDLNVFFFCVCVCFFWGGKSNSFLLQKKKRTAPCVQRCPFHKAMDLWKPPSR